MEKKQAHNLNDAVTWGELLVYLKSNKRPEDLVSIKSFNGKFPNSDGNMEITAADVNALANTGKAVKNSDIAQGAVYGDKLLVPTNARLGGVLADVKTEADWIPVHADGNGNLFVSGIVIQKLWENASPGSEFPAQTIRLESTKQYPRFLVDFKARTTGANFKTELINKNTENTVSVVYGTSNHIEVLYRTVEARDGSIYFRAAYVATSNTDTSNSAVMIPYAIYGVKGT